VSELKLEDLADDTSHRSRPGGRGCLPVLVALALIVAIGIFAYVKGVDLIRSTLSGPEDYSGTGEGSVVIEVKSGDTASAIADTLRGVDVVKSEEAFTDAAEADERSLEIQPGCYKMHKRMSGKDALALMLQDSTAVSCPGQVTLTIPEGLRASEILERIVSATGFSKQTVSRAFAKAPSLGLPRYAKGDPEGFLFPATYEVSDRTTAAGLVKAMVAKFTSEAADAGLESKARNLGISPYDAVVVASLVQAEARRVGDMAKVASVIYNRLDDGMPLQLDSTLHYAEGSRGRVVASEDLRAIKSPYNTYSHAGLPPTPIDSPGRSALEAALAPATTDYLYFVTVNLRTGDTRFARTFEAHTRNTDLYSSYCETSDAC
jgi:UPF0755 protein